MLVALGTFVSTLFLGATFARPLLAAAAPAAWVAGLVAVVWAWGQRVEFGQSSLALRGPWRAREIAYDAIETTELRWHEPHAAGQPDADVTARVRPRGGAPFNMTTTWGEISPLWSRVNGPLRARQRAALARGEVVTFRDETSAPWSRVLWAIAMALMFAESIRAHRGVVIFGAMFAVAMLSLWSDLRDWLRARAAGGLELSTEGLREIGRRRDDERDAYRQMRGPAHGWIPWSEVLWVLRNGHALRVGTRQRAEALYVSPKAEVDALYKLLTEHIERHRAPVDALVPESTAVSALIAQAERAEQARAMASAPVEARPATGVRIAVADPVELDAASPGEVDATTEHAARGQRASR